MNHVDEVNLLNFRVAVHSFLQTYYPQETEKLQMFFLRFQMYRHIAESLENVARSKLKHLKGKKPSLELNNDLLFIMQNLLDAADNYFKEKCYSLADKCLKMGALVELQIRIPDIKMINLTESEISNLLMNRNSFEEALIIANAYHKSDPEHWINPIYQQCIINGNYQFLAEYISTFPTTRDFYIEIASKFKADQQRSSRTVNFKKFLNQLDDYHLKYYIAKELNFIDVLEEMNKAAPEIIQLLTR